MTDDVTNKKMVVGFLFSGSRVLLVQKTHPKWQAGLLNGIGGVMEGDETPLDAMRREFEEETSYPGHEVLDWRHFATEMEPFGAYVYFFAVQVVNRRDYAWPHANDTGESLGWVHIHDLPHMRCVGNLNWLVPLALDWRRLKTVIVDASGDIREQATW